MAVNRKSHVSGGRGAPTNAVPQRFDLDQRIPDNDWLDERERLDEGPAPLRTSVTADHARSIISRNSSPDIGFDQSVNPYRGCEHGCIYCYARPTHAWLDLSPGLDFETRLFAKPDAAALLRRELAAANYQVKPIAIGTNTDPYQPIDRDWRLTRDIVALLAETGHPLYITTKSDRIMRDIDLLAGMAERGLVQVAVSVTTLDPQLARTMEPRAPHPDRRMKAIAALAQAGITVAVSVSPIIPAITDSDMEQILAAAAQAGATSATYIPLRLPHEVAPLFREWLDVHFPDRAAKVMAIVRDMRGGRDNDPAFGSRMKGQGIWAELLRARFRRATRAYGLDKRHPPLDCSHFVPPERDGQLRLL